MGWIPRERNSILFAYNEVAAGLEEDYVLLLNNDIRVEPGFVAPLLQALQEQPDALRCQLPAAMWISPAPTMAA